MKTGIDSANSKFQKRENFLLKRIREMQSALEARREFARQTGIFIEFLKSEGRITKEELSIFFKRGKQKK